MKKFSIIDSVAGAREAIEKPTLLRLVNMLQIVDNYDHQAVICIV